MVTLRDLVGYLPYFVVAGGVIYYFNFRDRTVLNGSRESGNQTGSDETLDGTVPADEAQSSNHMNRHSHDSDNLDTESATADNSDVGVDASDFAENDLLDQLADADEQTANEIYENLSPQLRARLAVRLEEFIDEEYEQFEPDGRAFQGGNPFLPEDQNDDDDIAGLTPEQINPRPQAGPSSSSSRNANRFVGAKKTKSLARRDRIRAYNEYMRQQGEAERLAQREFERQYGDIISLARKDRQQREAEAQRLIRERQEKKRKEEETQRQTEAQLKETLQTGLATSGRARLNGETEVQIAVQIPDAVVVSGGQWAVSLTEDNCRDLAKELKGNGKLTTTDLGDFLSGLY